MTPIPSVPGQTIWIINQYASTPDTGLGGRHYYLARELVRRGHAVTVIAASFSHLLREPPQIGKAFETRNEDGVTYVWVKVPRYAGAHAHARVLNWFWFDRKLRRLPAVLGDRPDVILVSTPSLISFLGAHALSRKTAARLVWEVRDIWPLTLCEIGGYSPRHPFIRLLQWIEDRACRHADRIISNLPLASNYFAGKGLGENACAWVPNGIAVDEFTDSEPLAPDIADRIPQDKFIVGYTGTLGRANTLDVLLDAAERLKAHSDIAFVLAGSGREEADLRRSIAERGLSNIIFLGPIRKKQVPSALARFDICYAGFRKSNLYRYGTSLNKLPEYMMAAKPIVFSVDSAFKPVEDADAGITVPAEAPQAIADAILTLRALPAAERQRLGANARAYALRQHDYAALAVKLESILLDRAGDAAPSALPSIAPIRVSHPEETA